LWLSPKIWRVGPGHQHRQDAVRAARSAGSGSAWSLSCYTLPQVLSITIFEKTLIRSALLAKVCQLKDAMDTNQLNLFEFEPDTSGTTYYFINDSTSVVYPVAVTSGAGTY
jgi:hypothetical protein